MTRWLVDGNNVLGARADGWWRDRERAMARLAGAIAVWAATEGERDVTVVFDGRPREGVEAPGIVVDWAPGGRNAADDAIHGRVAADGDPAELTVVTSDRGLVDRVRAAGVGNVVGAGAFRASLERDG